jgi:translation elongation factor EF-Ts
MAENYNMFDKFGGNIQKKKIEKALEMLRTESPQELRKKLGQFDTNEIMEKINEFDVKKLNQMGISMDDIKNTLTDKDYEKAAQILGPDGAAIIKKIKAMLK